MLHNFVAAAFTLAEHSRGFIRRLPVDHEVRLGYEQRVDGTFNAPLPRFVKGLRNFTQHHEVPAAYFSWDETDRFMINNGRVSLDAEVLRASADFTGAAADFLKDQHDVPLRNTVDEYAAMVSRLHAWLEGALESVDPGEVGKA